MKQITTALLIAFMCPVVLAREFPVIDGHGFDWLKPQTTKCRHITKKDKANFKTCDFFANGNAFGLPSQYHKCKSSAKSEYFIYETRSKCQEAIETMQANAP